MSREIGGSKKYFKYADLEPGFVLVDGKFIRSFQGKYGIQWEFLNNDGEVHVLNSAGQLNYKLETYCQPGDMVKIIYEGMIVLEKGPMAGKDSHQFKILDQGSEERTEPVAEDEPASGDEDDDDYDL